jgi:hypothetical protein
VSGHTEYGFEWGPLTVERTASLPEGRVVLTVKTDHRELTIYASRTGRSLRVFEGNRTELVDPEPGEAA